MPWIRDHYEKVVLGVMSLVLLALSWFLFQSAHGFARTFAGVRGEVPRSKKIATANLGAVEAAAARAAEPSQWKEKGSLFVSRPYILKDGKLWDPLAGDSPLYPPVPNRWIMDNELDILDSNVLAMDPDEDGFTNQDEFEAQSNPRDKASHPEYITKLRLARIVQKPFRLLFASHTDGDFAINTLDVRQPTQFLKLGDQIAGTPYKIVGFEPKKEVNPKTGAEKDISELTIEHTETGKRVVLVVAVIVNSPDSFALFQYLWNNSQFQKKKDEEFSLDPEKDVVYKLVDIESGQAVLENLKTRKKTTLRLDVR